MWAKVLGVLPSPHGAAEFTFSKMPVGIVMSTGLSRPMHLLAMPNQLHGVPKGTNKSSTLPKIVLRFPSKTQKDVQRLNSDSLIR
jgi:hypothetical protein